MNIMFIISRAPRRRYHIVRRPSTADTRIQGWRALVISAVGYDNFWDVQCLTSSVDSKYPDTPGTCQQNYQRFNHYVTEFKHFSTDCFAATTLVTSEKECSHFSRCAGKHNDLSTTRVVAVHAPSFVLFPTRRCLNSTEQSLLNRF